MTIRLWDLAGAEDDRRFSPYCWRVKMALRHKGLHAEEIPWRFTEKDAIAFSGQGLVPVITDDDREVHDSWAIATYLDQAYPDRPMLFGGDEARTLAFFFKHWVERNVHPAVMKVIVIDLFNHLHEKDLDYFRRSREKRYGKTLESYAAEPRAALAALRGALEAYFAGRAVDFDIPLAPAGTPFQQAVWQALRGIPYGATASYAEIARHIGRPRAVRAVGLANARNPIAIIVPCHRVIGADGTLTGYAGGLERKQALLELESRAR